MDLAAIIKRKREQKDDLKSKASASAVASGGNKYMRQGDIEKARKKQYKETLSKERSDRKEAEKKRTRAREAEQRRRDEHTRRRAKLKDSAARAAAGPGGSRKTTRGDDSDSDSDEGEVMLALPKNEVATRLRNMGEPVTLFGESNQERFLRLRYLEKHSSGADDTALEGSYLTRNRFLEGDSASKEEEDDDDDDDDDESDEDDVEITAKTPKRKSRPTVEADIALETTKQKGRYVKRYLRTLLKEWAVTLRDRDDSKKKLASGKVLTKTHKQCKDYIRPFFKQLKTSQVPPDILLATRRIVCFCEQREYVKANDLYVQMAIGNAPWPIGVTMVGIHARGGRDRIKSNKVAHVMNDEMMRKYITSIKRLMKFAQTKYSTDPSKMVL